MLIPPWVTLHVLVLAIVVGREGRSNPFKSEIVTEMKLARNTMTKAKLPYPSGAIREYDPSAWSKKQVQFTVNLWKLTAKEQTKLEELGRRIQDIHHFKNRPSDVIRFLKHHNYNINKAETNFRNMVAWRKKNGVDTILQDYTPPDTIKDYYPYSILKGEDKDGDPVLIRRSGVMDAVGLLKCHGMDEMMRFSIWCNEMVWSGPWIRQYEEQRQQPIKLLTVIDDAHEMKIMAHISNRALMKAFGAITKMEQENYPYPAKRIFVTRAPSLLQRARYIVKLFYPPEVVEMLHFLAVRDYQLELSRHMDLEILPEELVPGIGKGEARDGFPAKFCGGPVPQ